MTDRPVSGPRYLPSDVEELELRCEQRLREELGISPGDVEVILHLRRQVFALQERVKQLESELSMRHTVRQARLAHYHQTTFEATWWEIEGWEGERRDQ